MRIAWSEPALADLAAIHDYIARDSAHYAQRYVVRLIAAVEPLETFPQLGRIVPEGDGRHREILLHPYRIIYRVEGQEILIVTVVHGRRDLAGADKEPWDRT
ncbi:MAG TPA: type II toxin-antitoxin system RelE/ParE family toxin [Thermoanaerobaculia bacterium]|nr:type II toxin-antitoxin system RelE/ParE family toxin [Thermoanaerobaculia bacterium]